MKFTAAGALLLGSLAMGSRFAPASYQLKVTNTMPHGMTIAFKDSAEHRLGDLEGGESHTYSITNPASPSIQVIAHIPLMGADNSREVVLSADSAVAVAF